MAVLGRINTKGLLGKRGIIGAESNVCTLCQDHPETIEHLLIHCPVSWMIWCKLMQWWGIVSRLPSSVAELFDQWVSWCTKKMLVSSTFCYNLAIWLERNQLQFGEKEGLSDNLIVYVILQRVAAWLIVPIPPFPILEQSYLELLKESVGGAMQKRRRGELFLGCPPDPNTFKWNTDGSSLGKPGDAAVGGVLRNHRGEFLRVFCIPIGIADSNEAELVAILKALQLSREVDFLCNGEMVIESDSVNALTWVNKMDEAPWKYWDMLNEIKWSCNAFKSVFCEHQ